MSSSSGERITVSVFAKKMAGTQLVEIILRNYEFGIRLHIARIRIFNSGFHELDGRFIYAVEPQIKLTREIVGEALKHLADNLNIEGVDFEENEETQTILSILRQHQG